MKTKIKLMLAVIAAVVFVACNGNVKNEQAAEEVAVVEDVQVSDTVAVGAKPKVIDLYATWCGPCKMIAPILEELEKEYAGKVVFEKVDIDENRAIAEQYQVEAIPTLIFMTPDGTYEKKVGFMEKDAIKAEIAKLLE